MDLHWTLSLPFEFDVVSGAAVVVLDCDMGISTRLRDFTQVNHAGLANHPVFLRPSRQQWPLGHQHHERAALRAPLDRLPH